MSTDERLKRLGLEHLRDNPEELKKEIDRRLQERQKKEAEWRNRHNPPKEEQDK